VRRALKLYLTPGWFGLTVLLWGAAVGMVFLGRWQLDVSNTKHFNLQNFAYAIQWWLFSGFSIWFWGRLIRNAWRPPAQPGSTSGELVLRSSGLAPVGPAELISHPEHAGDAAVVYRGYVMPQSTTAPIRSEGDPMHGAYNDYLWQLSLSDQAEKNDES
jgi:hypothetical protein